MAKIITFSLKFPAYHPKSGNKTFFVEKIWNGFSINILPYIKNYENIFEIDPQIASKYHTIRVGKRWKTGDKASLRIWLGRPYFSKQIEIAPEVTIIVFDFEIIDKNFLINGRKIGSLESVELAMNDGLLFKDFLNWFQFPNNFYGQIICWNDKIKY